MSAPFLFSIPLFCSHRRLRCHTLDPIIEFFRFFPFASQKERENEEWERERVKRLFCHRQHFPSFISISEGNLPPLLLLIGNWYKRANCRLKF